MPERLQEACGTSGMKVLVNGGLNLSVPDGWWAEVDAQAVGWSIGVSTSDLPEEALNRQDADTLYDLLENHIAPAFYDRSDQGIPTRWVSMVRNSMATLGPRFSSNRMAREYTAKHYLTLAAETTRRSRDDFREGRKLASWLHAIREGWDKIHIGDTAWMQSGDIVTAHVQIELGVLSPQMIRVELFAESPSGDMPERHTMQAEAQLSGGSSCYRYAVSLGTQRAPSDYTVRITPQHSHAAVPLEAPYVLWQR